MSTLDSFLGNSTLMVEKQMMKTEKLEGWERRSIMLENNKERGSLFIEQERVETHDRKQKREGERMAWIFECMLFAFSKNCR